MAAAKRSFIALEDFPPSFRDLLTAGYPMDCPEIGEAWQRYFISRSAQDEQLLFGYYAPLLSINAVKNVRGNPELFDGPLDDYISDGTLGLLNFIRTARVYRASAMVKYAGQAIRRAIWQEARARTWAGRKRIESTRTIQRIRAELVAKTGEVPTREALTAALAEKVKNPQIYFFYLDEGVRAMTPRSQMEKADGRKLMRDEDPKAQDPSERMMHQETVRLAMKGLGKEDRQILRMVLAGKDCVAIGKALGLSRSAVSNRLNGVLWEARCRADLAEHLGVEPDEAPVKDGYRRFIPISKLPPARLVG